MAHLSPRLLLLLAAALVMGLSATLPTAGQDKPEPPKPRLDAYGDPLPEGAVARLGTERFWQRNQVAAIAVSPDGKTVVTGGVENRVIPLAGGGWTISNAGCAIRFWDARTGRHLRAVTVPRGVVRSLAFSPNGKLLAIGNGSETLLLDMPDGKLLRPLAQRCGNLVQFTTGGNAVITEDADEGIRTWDVATGKLLGKWRVPKRPPGGIEPDEDYSVGVLCPDRKRLAIRQSRSGAIGGKPGTVSFQGEYAEVFDAATGKKLYRSGPSQSSIRMIFSPDGKYLTVVGDSVEVLDSRSGKQVQRFKDYRSPHAIAFSPDCTKLLTVDGYDRATCRDLATGKVLRQFSVGPLFLFDDPSQRRRLAFASDGRIVWVSNGRVVRGWDVTTGAEVPKFSAHRTTVSELTYSRDGKVLTSSCGEAVAKWDVFNGKLLQYQRLVGLLPDEEPDAISISLERAVLRAGPGKCRLLDIDTGKTLGSVQGIYEEAGGGVTRFLFLGRSLFAIVGTDRDGAQFVEYDPNTGKKSRDITLESTGFEHLAASPDGKLYVTCSAGAKITLLDAASGKLLRRFTRPCCVVKKGKVDYSKLYRFAFSPDGKFLASALSDYGGSLTAEDYARSAVQVWEVATGREVCRVQATPAPGGRFAVASFAVSSDGRFVALGLHGEDTVRVWETASGTERGQRKGHRGVVWALAFSPDGRQLASGSTDTTILVWDLHRPFRAAPTKARLTVAELTAHWETLARRNGSEADTAIWALVNAPSLSIRLLRERLTPARPVQLSDVQRWVADLESDNFRLRSKATRELTELAELAVPELEKALRKNLTLEARQRIQVLLEKTHNLEPPPERLRQTRAVEVLEKIGTPEAKQLLRALAGGAPEARLTAEARAALARLEARPR